MRVELLLEHNLFPVTVVFDAAKLKDVRKTGENSAQLPVIEGRYKKKTIHL